MRRALLAAGIAWLALIPRAADSARLTTALSSPRTPVGGRATTDLGWRSSGADLTPIAAGAHPSGVIAVIEGARKRLFLSDSLASEPRFAARARSGAELGFATRVFASSGLQVWTLDSWNARIERYDLSGRSELVVDLAALAENAGYAIGEAADFCLDPSGDLFVLDSQRGRVLHFDREGGFIALLGEAGEVPLAAPVAIDVDGRGRLFILETRPPSVLVLDPDGRTVRRSLEAVQDSAAGGASQPVSLAVDLWGNAYVGDGKRVAVFVLPDRGPSWWLPLPDSAAAPVDLVFAPDRRLLAADPASARVWVTELDFETIAARSPSRSDADNVHEP